jgi:hypothetical protein
MKARAVHRRGWQRQAFTQSRVHEWLNRAAKTTGFARLYFGQTAANLSGRWQKSWWRWWNLSRCAIGPASVRRILPAKKRARRH